MREDINKLQDFCDMEALQHILKTWAQATNMGIIVFDTENETVLGPYGFPPYCHLVYGVAGGRLGCKENAAKAESSLRCHAGLHEFTVMVQLPSGKPLAKIICGQIKSPGAIPP